MLFNGCSHTAGSEIEYQFQSICYEKSWGKWLCDMTNEDYINIARPGAGNEYIFRTTQDWIIKNVFLNKLYNKKDLHIIVMWSGFDRQEVYFPDTNNSDNVNPHSDPKLHTTSMQFEVKALQDVIVYFHDFLYSNLKSLMLINNLSNFLEINDIKYTFLNSINSFIDLKELNNKFRNHAMYQSYNNNLWLYNDTKKNKHLGFSNENETFFHHLNSKFKWSIYSEKGHFGEESHKYWAKKVYDFIHKPIESEPKIKLI